MGKIIFDPILAKLRTQDGASSGSATQSSGPHQGYYGLLSGFYSGDGVLGATDTIVSALSTDTWNDVSMVIDSEGTYDNRTAPMKEAQAAGHSGLGIVGSPFVFNLEGLTTESFASFKASLVFTPDEDGGQLETRLLFNKHGGLGGESTFAIEEVTLSMEQGADVDYTADPLLSFFISDAIDTNGPGDAGTFKFQFRTSVPGTISFRALTAFLYQ